jgi:hypothetical protein
MRLLLVIVLTILTVSLFKESAHINDEKEYLNTAYNLLEKNALYAGDLSKPLDYRRFAKRPLGFPLFILMQHQLSLLIALAQIFLLVLTYFCGLFLLRFFSSKKIAFTMYNCVYGLNLAFIIHSTFIFSDLILASVLSCMLLVLYDQSIIMSSKLKWLGILWAISLAIKPILLPTLLLFPILVIIIIVKRYKVVWQLYLPILVFLITSLINQRNTGTFEYSSMSTINLVQYNARLTIANSYGYDSAMQYAKNKAFIVPKTKEEYSTYKEEATKVCLTTITDNLYSYLKIHVIGSIKMLIDPGRYEIYTFLGLSTANNSLTEQVLGGNHKEALNHIKEKGWVMILFLSLLVVSLMKFLGFVFSFSSFKKTWILFAAIIYFMAISGPVGAARLFLPMVMPYTVLVVLGWIGLLNLLQKRTKS